MHQNIILLLSSTTLSHHQKQTSNSMSSVLGNLVSKVVSCFLLSSLLLAGHTASAFTYTGSTAIPQGKFYDSNGKVISVTKVSNGSITFSNSKVAKIGNYAFHNCTGLKKFELPSTVTEIGFLAFSNCDNLTEAICNSTIFARLPQSASTYEIMEGTKSIASGACRQCTNLTSIVLPNSITKIGESAFADCSSLTSITIPNNTESIGEYAFYNCTKLSTIYIETTKISGISSKAFEGVDKTTCILFVPAGKKSAFSNFGFEHILEIPAASDNHAPVLVVTGSYSGESFKAINNSIDKLNALVVDLTSATIVDGMFTPTNKNVLYKTSKKASDLKLKNTENVVVNGVCDKFILTDGFAFGNDAEFTATKASYTRTLSSTWGTICLPFLTKSNNSIQYYTAGSVTDDILTLESTSVVNAGQPAIFKLLSGSKVDISRSSEKVKIQTIGSENNSSKKSIRLYGTFTRQELEDEGLYYIANDKFWLKTNGTPLIVNPFRAWFSLGSNQSNSRELSIEDCENEAASLDALDAMAEGTALFFDEQGQPRHDLQKGLNIVRMPDGRTKKIFLK